MSEKKLDFSKLPVGTELYGFPHNLKGKISKVYDDKFMLRVDYPDGGEGEYYFDGTNEYHSFSLISTRPFVPPEAFCDEPLPNIKKGTVVFVKGKMSESWLARVFSHFREDGKIVCFQGGFGDRGETTWFDEYRLDNPFLEK